MGGCVCGWLCLWLQSGLQVTALSSHRTAYGKLAEDNASILKKLEELKGVGASGVSVLRVR